MASPQPPPPPSRRPPAMTYFYRGGDDLRRNCRFHSRFLFRRRGPQTAEVSVSRGVSVSCRRFHTFPTSPARGGGRTGEGIGRAGARSRAPRNANKQVSEPVSQTSKHVVAVSCYLVGAEVTRISRREFNSVDVGWRGRQE